jgi:hypothetical protein
MLQRNGLSICGVIDEIPVDGCFLSVTHSLRFSGSSVPVLRFERIRSYGFLRPTE